ncbi:MAG TPA: S-adenosylmethionine:tRNA ribosyltransferase-isomerase [Polyangiaceae bacterium]
MTGAAAAVPSFLPARAPRAPLSERLLHVDPRARSFADRRLADLPSLLRGGDLVVVNDAATLPASLRMTSHDAELRLLARAGDGTFRAVAFGPGDFRSRTEERAPPPRFSPDSVLAFGELRARVVAVDPEEARLLFVRFDRDGRELFEALYRVGRVVQYAYVERPLELWEVQNRYASRPWAFEPPSAGRPLTFGLLGELRSRGVALASLTHAAGLSSTGSASLDRRLPLEETSDIPDFTVSAIERAKARGGRVVAVGTTVVRALEGRALDAPRLSAGRNETSLVIGPGFPRRVVDGVLTGLHDASTSHFALLGAFAERSALVPALEHAAHAGYLEHEFGDSCLVLASSFPA